MDFNLFIDWGMKTLLGAIVMNGVRILGEMKRSIDMLNNSMTKIIERTDWHSREITRLENKVERLESAKAMAVANGRA